MSEPQVRAAWVRLFEALYVLRSHGWCVYEYGSGENSEKYNIEITTPDRTRLERVVDVME